MQFLLYIGLPLALIAISGPLLFSSGKPVKKAGRVQVAQTTSTYTAPTGTYTPPSGTTYTAPTGTYTPPSGTTYTAPTGTYTAPAGTTYPAMPYPTDMNSYPSTGTYTPPSGTTYTPPTGGTYPSGPYPVGDMGGYPMPPGGSFGGTNASGPGGMMGGPGGMMGGPGSFGGTNSPGNYPMPPGGQGGMMGVPGGMMGGPGGFGSPAGDFSGRGPGGMMGGHGGNMGQGHSDTRWYGGDHGGPTDGDFDKRHADEEKKNVERMKKDFMRNGFMGLKEMEKQVSKLEKQGITIPQDISQAVAKLNELKNKISAATTQDELMELQSDLQEQMQFLSEKMPTLHMLSEYKKMRKEPERMIKQLEKQLASALKRATSAKIDIGEEANQILQIINNMKAILAKVDQLAVSGQAEDVFETMREIFEGSDEVGPKFQAIEIALNYRKFDKMMKSELSRRERLYKRLAKKPEGEELAPILAELKERYAEFKAAISSKPVDVDVLQEVGEAFFELAGQFDEASGQGGDQFDSFFNKFKGFGGVNEMPMGDHGGPGGMMGGPGGFGGPGGMMGGGPGGFGGMGGGGGF